MAKEKSQWTVQAQHEYEMPSRILLFDDFSTIVPFYLYRAAPTNDTTLSWDIPSVLGAEGMSRLYIRMMGKHLESFRGTTSVARESDWAGRMRLADQNLDFDQEKGIFYQRAKQAKGSSDYSDTFDSLLRHIRNAVAHGRMRKEGEYLLLEDRNGKSVDAKGKPKPLTARIVVRPSTLTHWARLIDAVCGPANS